MNPVQSILNVFKKKKDSDLRENPDITIYCFNDRKHALYVNNPDGFDVSDKGMIAKRRYTLFARDIDQNKKDEEQLEDLEREHIVIIPSHSVLSITNWSSYRKINLILPDDVNDLPEQLKPVFGQYIAFRKAEFDIVNLRSETDKKKTLAFKKTMSTFEAQLDSTKEKQIEALKELNKKVERET